MNRKLRSNYFFKNERILYFVRVFAFLLTLLFAHVQYGNAARLNTGFNVPAVQADLITIKGKITDYANDLVLMGVSVKIKGSTAGTISDANGTYTIKAAGDATLIFSYIGYQTLEVPVKNRSLINIILQTSGTSLSDVIVVGYGTQKRSDLTGSIAVVANKDLRDIPTSRLDEALQGKSPGVVVQNNNAAPNGQVTIRIRGSNSINGSNDPLIVIDGFIGGNLSSLNPNDIESTQVLKDASSTAIYGSRGANGVIVITTKKGRSGQSVVQYNDYVSFTSLRKKLDLLNAGQYAETVNADRLALGISQVYTADQIASFYAKGGTDWQGEIFKTGIQQSHEISVSGGGKQSLFFLSGGYTNNQGIIKNTSFQQFRIRSNVETNLNDHFRVGLNLYIARSEDHPTALNGFANGSPTFASTLFAPTLPVYNADGTYTLPSSQVGPPTVNNPLALAVEPINDNILERTEITPFLEYKIIDGLTARFTAGARIVNNQNSYYYNTKPQDGIGNATAGISNSKNVVLQSTNQLTYQKIFSKVHELNVTGVYEVQQEQYNGDFAGATGFLTDAVTYNNLGLGANPLAPYSTKNTRRIRSFLGRINYAYNEKYLLSISARDDGASVFGANNPTAFFPSGAVAWHVSRENFMKSVSAVTDLKVRASYGLTGNQGIPPYSALSQLSTSSPYPINGTSLSTGVGLGSLGNPNLKWETTAQFDMGLDLSLFHDRIQFTTDYYRKKTTDLLLNVPVPLASGYTSQLENVGSLENKGFEFSLVGRPFVGAVKWTSGFNIEFNRNKVLSLANGLNEVPLGGPGLPNFGNTVFLEVGQPLGVFKGYTQNGVWGTAETAQAAKYGAIPGAPRYVDENNDGVINSKDIVIIGNAYPKFTYGWSNNVSYNHFDLNVFIQGSRGNKIYNLSRVRSERSSGDADATDIRILNRWTPTNQNTDVPSFQGSNGYEQLQSSRWLEDGSYLRVKNITLGYTLPKSFLGKVKISSLRVYVTGYNLITLTKYTGYDPESSSGVDTYNGIDLATYPSQKSITVGVNLTL